MQEPAKAPQSRPHKARPDPKGDAAEKQKKAETAEVLGRHRNSGQKDHKGAR